MHLFVTTIQKHTHTLFIIALLSIISFIYSTHLSLSLVPKGYDLLFHLGNVFALQVAFDFKHISLASFGISPLLFHDYGYGTHLFYPPLAHFIPAMISFLLSKVGVDSTLLAIRLFSFLSIFGSSLTMFYTAKKISNNIVYATFASLLYISAPYLQMDYYWRGGMSSSLCFVFLPLLLLSLYYFIKEKFAPYFFTLVISLSLLVWTHLITAFYSFIIIMLALGVNFFFLKNKKTAFITTAIAGIMICIMTSPFWTLLIQQQTLQTHVIYSPEYPFNIGAVANSTIDLHSLFDIQIAVWEFKIRNLFAIFNITGVIFFTLFILLLKQVHRQIDNKKYIYTLVGIFILIIIFVTTSQVWEYLPNYFAFIQYPHRLLLQVTPVLTLLLALPCILIKKINKKIFLFLSILVIFIVAYTFKFNNYELQNLGSIDYTTHSIIQAMGVEREYLPIKTKEQFETFDERPFSLIPLTNTEKATPSATIVTNETPYLLAAIENNEDKQTVFELPRLFYAGYELMWQADGAATTTSLTYNQSNTGLITTMLEGNGMLEVQYTGGRWYFLFWLGAVITFGYLLVLMYTYSTKKTSWLEKL